MTLPFYGKFEIIRNCDSLPICVHRPGPQRTLLVTFIKLSLALSWLNEIESIEYTSSVIPFL